MLRYCFVYRNGMGDPGTVYGFGETLAQALADFERQVGLCSGARLEILSATLVEGRPAIQYAAIAPLDPRD